MASITAANHASAELPTVQADDQWQTVTRRGRAGKATVTVSTLTSSDSTDTPSERQELMPDSPNHDDKLNEELLEKLSRVGIESDIEPGYSDDASEVGCGSKIQEYFSSSAAVDPNKRWLAVPDFPTSAEIAVYGTNECELPANKIDGAWEDREEYLQSHYELLREDAVAPLREAVAEFHSTPYMLEKDSRANAGIYEKVYITGLTFAHQGIAARVEFSLRRAEKRIRWAQSKRLTSGTVVALSTAQDKFNKICKVAVVAARPLVGLLQRPPTIDIFFTSVEEVEIDPQQEWIMIESRSGYFEAYRHTLRALQKLSTEKFPMVEHVVNLAANVQAPSYLQEQPLVDLSPALSNDKEDFDINVLDEWPELTNSNLDQSQLAALRRILTKRLAVVQGPPGTGKTHVSVVALKILLSNMSTKEPPIIVTAQTNHALDQLLRLVASFEPKFIRLGGRTADHLIIKPRTLFAIRKESAPVKNRLVSLAMKSRESLSQDLRKLLDPLSEGKEPFTSEFLQTYGLLTQAQVNSLAQHAENWSGVSVNGTTGVMGSWLEEYLIPAVKAPFFDSQSLENEEVDLTFEQLRELEAESGMADDDSFELLRGEWVPLVEPYIGRAAEIKDEKVEQLLRDRQDLWRIPAMFRGSVYNYLRKKAKEEMLKRLRAVAPKYSSLAQNLQIAKWERDYSYLKDARIIGMTTTGLSKYRALVASLGPRIVLIEEAAEALEAPVIAACFESLEHLILVGDHQQLRGHCAIQDLEGEPFYLDISMFERLVRNNFEYSQLTRQRRMRPEIRRIISPIYEQLQDHPCVKDREDVPGMGGVNSFFHSHTWPESNDNAMSKRNLEEADMVIGFFDYLVYNGMDANDITVLTFYNGQRKTILHGLKSHRNFQGSYTFKVATVDSYQGEENEVILLSLVRNNPKDIGFLNIDNRVCVALSRARRGFYIFGNDRLLRNASLLWKKVLKVMEHDPPRIGHGLPITCKKHGKKTIIRFSSELDELSGGCKTRCRGTLPCGHDCDLKCHPFVHAVVKCQEPCSKIQGGCGHQCLELCCTNPCRCACGKRAYIPLVPYHILIAREDDPNPTKSIHESQVKRIKGTHAATDARLDREFEPFFSTGSPNGPRSRANSRPKERTEEEKRVLSPQAKAWEAYAAGGHEKEDKKLQAEFLEQCAEAERKAMDDEMERALFEPELVVPSGEAYVAPDRLVVEKGKGMEMDLMELDVESEESPRKRVVRESVWVRKDAAEEKEEASLLD